MKKETGKVIRQLRLESGLSQDQLVDKIDMSKAYLSEIERGIKQPSLESIFRIARALNVKGWEIVKKIEEDLDKT